MPNPSSEYPQGRKFFAHRYIRLLTKTCAAQEIGHIAFCLCVTVAHQEDAKRYKGAVTYYNGQLLPLVGVDRWETLDHARARAMDAGWLHYEPGGTRRPGLYWVTIPDGLDDIPDTPCDETPQKMYLANSDNDRGLYLAASDNASVNASVNASDPSTLFPKDLTPTPSPKKETAPAVALSTGLLELIDGWNNLGEAIVKKSNGARRDPPAKSVIAGWTKATKNPEQSPCLEDIPALLDSIRGATFCHGQGWFALEWLFAKNKIGKFNLCQIVSGAHSGSLQNGKPQPVPNPARIHEQSDSYYDALQQRAKNRFESSTAPGGSPPQSCAVN